MLESKALTERSRALLITLSTKVRFLTLDQIVRTWWPASRSGHQAARAVLRQLDAEGFLERRDLPAHPELSLDAPVHQWCPGEAAPDFGGLAYRLQSRWTQPLSSVTVYHATRKTARRFGGFGGVLKFPLQATHDLHVSQIYLRLLESDATATVDWVSEEALSKILRPRPGDKLPDAVLADPNGGMRLVLEFGGAYDRARVQKLHRYCERQEVPYQLW